MPAYLVFTLYGPLQSWGEAAVGEVRSCADRPTKSGVLGLIGAALGISREDDGAMSTLHRNLGFAVRVDTMGTHIHDFHTSQTPTSRKGGVWPTRKRELEGERLNTILSTRHYRGDACYTVALRIRGDLDPTSIIEAFRKPAYPLYLGRRSCPPALPIHPVLLEAADLGEAFSLTPLPDQLSGMPPGRRVFFDEADVLRVTFRHQRNDRLISSGRRTYGDRVEFEGLLPTPKEA